MVLTEEERRERQRISKKKYLSSEKGRTYNKNYLKQKRLENKKKGINGDEIKPKGHLTEAQKKAKKKYRQSDKGKKTMNNYINSENGKKGYLRSSWKSQGIKLDNFEEIYERYTNAIFCDICECVLDVNGRNKKCMDHDHDTGDFRNIVCNYCNLHICK